MLQDCNLLQDCNGSSFEPVAVLYTRQGLQVSPIRPSSPLGVPSIRACCGALPNLAWAPLRRLSL